MKLSIIIPVYNVELFIRRCLESIISQIDNSDEIILVNDGSTDSSGMICDEYANKKNIHVIHKSNGGLSDARNKGIDYASGDYLIFIDSDDYVSNDFISNIKSVLSKYQYDIVNFGYNIVDMDDVVKSTHHLCVSSSIHPEEALKEILLDRNINNFAWANAYKKNLFDNIRYPVGVLFEDKYTTYKLYNLASSVYHIANPLYYYLVRDGSICHPNNLDRKLKGALDNIEGLMQQYHFAKINLLQSCEISLSDRICSCCVSICRSLYKNGRYHEINKLRIILLKNFSGVDIGFELNLFLNHPSLYKILMLVYGWIK